MKTQIFFDLGENQFRQRMELVAEKDGSFTFIQHAASQRDETTTIRNLTKEIVANMTKAINMKVV